MAREKELSATPATHVGDRSTATSPSEKSDRKSDSDKDEWQDLVKEYAQQRLRAPQLLAKLELRAASVQQAGFGDLVQAVLSKGRPSVQEAEQLLQWLRQRKLLAQARRCGDLYAHVGRALAHRGALDKAELLMVEMAQHGVPTGSLAAALFDAAVRAGKSERAWWLLETALQGGARVDKVAVSLLLKRGPHAPARLHLVEQLIQLHKDSADEVLFNSLLAAYCRAEDMPSLERVCAAMMALGVPPSAATFGTLLKAYGARGDFGAVRKTWEGMKAAGIGINSVTYGCMLDACVRCKQFQQAELVFQELRDAGMHKNTILFSTMIKAYAKRKDLAAALSLKQEMLDAQVPLNCVTYNSLIDVAVRCQDYQTALGLLDEMEASGLRADLITYSTLIKGLTELGMLSEAMQLFVQVEQSGFKVDEILINSLLDGCSRAKAEPAVALALLERMRQHRIRPSQVTLCAVARVFANKGQAKEALAFLGTCHASEHVLATLVKQLAQEGFLQEACETLQALPLPLPLYAHVLPLLASEPPQALGLLQTVVGLLAHGAPRRQLRELGQALPPVLAALQQEHAAEVEPLVEQLVALRVLQPGQVEKRPSPLSIPTPNASPCMDFVPGQAWTSSGAQWWKQPLTERAEASPTAASPKRRSNLAENRPDNTPHVVGKPQAQPGRAPLGAALPM